MANEGDRSRLVGLHEIRRAIRQCEKQLEAFRLPKARRERWRVRAEGLGYPRLGVVLQPEGQGITRALCDRAAELLALVDLDAPSVYCWDALEADGFIVSSPEGRLYHSCYPEPIPPVAEPGGRSLVRTPGA